MFGRSPVAPNRRGSAAVAEPAAMRPRKSRRFRLCGMTAYSSSMGHRMIKLPTLALIVLCCTAAVSPQQERDWREGMRAALFVPEKLPALDAQVHGRFQLEPGIVAERVTY